MQFVVPQFIDVEDKIIGPITVRQFVILLVASLLIFAEYKLSDMALFLVLSVPTAVVFGVIAFLRINGMPFHYFFINVVETVKRPSGRIWNREDIVQVAEAVKKILKDVKINRPPLERRRLNDLSLIVDTGGYFKGQEREQGEVTFNK